MRKSKNRNELTLAEHVKELKSRILKIVGVLILAFLFCYLISSDLMGLVLALGRKCGYNLVYLAPQEVLLQRLRIAFVCALFITVPIIVFEVTAFISPIFSSKKALHYIIASELFSVAMFVVGALFAIKCLLPFIYRYLYEMGKEANIVSQISVESFISLFLTIMFCMGAIFQMPLVCIVLTKLGVTSAKGLQEARSFVVVIVFIVAAIITPPDVISQIIVAIPMIGLYQISILICKFINRNERSDK